MTMAGFIAFYFSVLATNHSRISANTWSLSQETLYATIHSIVVNQINNKSGQAYFPFMYCLFILILINNLIGMIPYSFASTSHFILALSLSFTVVLGATVLGFKEHGLKFFSLFVPAGCPLGLLPLLVLIEFISYLARNVSLGLRLAANILSGHMLLNILSGFSYNIMSSGIIFFILGLLPLLFLIYDNLFFLFLNKGIGIFGGLFNTTATTNVFHIFIFLISSIILFINFILS